MSDASRDVNRAVVGLAWNGSTTKPLLVDATTGRLLINVETTTQPTATDREVVRDANRQPVAGAYNDTEIEPVKVDTSNNVILDFTV